MFLVPQPMMDDKYCIISSNTVTGICTALMAAPGKMCAKMGDATLTPIPVNHTSISGTLSVRIAVYSKILPCKKKLFVDYKYRHGNMVENDVAKCSGPSCSYIGIEAIWITLFSVVGTVGGN
ncbi:hypothetical protein KIN20_005927 [Parelaphostrongylus tenuis]|uniref:Uncharacterized protein n=1 Tax=Parelaphostrongylus tenuis TaxID=148309 RepID=A0AAD5MM84_PARTN|nr:hypothetical protein KIN20_005927 [Parelaphostrongylus tenuis]